MKKILIVLVFLAINAFVKAQSHMDSSFASTDRWLQDQTTIKFPNGETRNYLSGVRLIFEPQWGTLIQNDKNRIDEKFLMNMSKFGIETNIYQGWIALQINYIFPTHVEFDSQSDIVVNSYLKNSEKKADLDIGFSVGLSFFDGIIAVGAGWAFLDERDFIDSYNGSKSIDFVYINIQAVSTVKTLLKVIR